MKKLLLKKSLILLVSFGFLFTACDEVAKKLTVDVPVNTPPIELNLLNNDLINGTQVQKVAALIEEDVVLAEKEINIGLYDKLSEENRDIKNLKKIIFNEGKLVVKEPQDYDLTTLNGLKVYFEEDLVAEVVEVVESTRTLKFRIQKDDIKKYTEKELIKVTVKGKQKITVPKIVTDLYLKFTAKVGLK